MKALLKSSLTKGEIYTMEPLNKVKVSTQVTWPRVRCPMINYVSGLGTGLHC
jgi:hypothetical protein